ncbi:putative small lipoprotein YifL [Bartonella callosciuri]|uniref:Putative small lipoprotein YifL n=1 Tax=Bartonella callosciuri TaxID=686223 RepID=A0A840NWQ0_9HYPH|nr:lipoprotein [Bartonella callosciuri]MBB5073679.1 putative small lipoprotein YifL [Bartonella callosciuri]
MKIILKNLTIILLGSIIIVGCGRKGPLEMPSPSVKKSVQGASVAKSEEDKPFILDRLIK